MPLSPTFAKATSYEVGYYRKVDGVGIRIEVVVAGNVFPGIIPADNIPERTVMLAVGINRTPQDTNLADDHLPVPVVLGSPEK